MEIQKKNRMKKVMINLIYYEMSMEMTLLTGSNAYSGYVSVNYHMDIAWTVRMTLLVLPNSLDRNNI